MPAIEYQQRKVFYQVEGKGFPLVLLHGFCEDHRVWDELVEQLDLGRILRIDLPGFGQSAPLERGSIDDFAAGVKAVLDELRIDRCVMVGHSMGGYTTLAFAERYPEYLAGWGLFHSHPFADTEVTRINRAKSREFIQRNGSIPYVKQLFPKLFPPSFLTSQRYISDRLTHWASQFPTEGIQGGLEAMAKRPDRTDVLRHSEVPVLFILGDQDELIPFHQQLAQTHLPDIAQIHVFPKVGHMGLLEAPKKGAAAIQQFYQFCTAQS